VGKSLKMSTAEHLDIFFENLLIIKKTEIGFGLNASQWRFASL